MIAKEIMERGELVPDTLVNEMVAVRLKQPDTGRGTFWTVIRAPWGRPVGWTQWLGERSGVFTGRCREIKVNYNQLLRRITGRRNCPVCQTIYNIYMQPPEKEGICSLDGAALIQRVDDTEEVFNERMRTYEALTTPVIEHYRSLGRFAEVDGDRPIEEVAAEIVATVKRLRKRNRGGGFALVKQLSVTASKSVGVWATEN